MIPKTSRRISRRGKNLPSQRERLRNQLRQRPDQAQPHEKEVDRLNDLLLAATDSIFMLSSKLEAVFPDQHDQIAADIQQPEWPGKRQPQDWAAMVLEELQDSRAEVRELRTTVISLQQDLKNRTEWAFELDRLQKERTEWALGLDEEIDRARQRIQALQQELDARTAWALSLNEQISQKPSQTSRSADHPDGFLQFSSVLWKLSWPMRWGYRAAHRFIHRKLWNPLNWREWILRMIAVYKKHGMQGFLYMPPAESKQMSRTNLSSGSTDESERQKITRAKK